MYSRFPSRRRAGREVRALVERTVAAAVARVEPKVATSATEIMLDIFDFLMFANSEHVIRAVK